MPDSTDRNAAAMIAEYSALRAEIIQYGALGSQVAGIGIPVLGAIAVYGILHRDPVAMLAAATVVIAMEWITAVQADNMVLLSSYISGVLEPSLPGLRWETAYHNWVTAKRSGLWAATLGWAPLLYVVIFGACGLYAIVLIDGDPNSGLRLAVMGICGVLLALAFALAFRMVNVLSPARYEGCIRRWQDLTKATAVTAQNGRDSVAD